jgi:hypothetical protein
LAQRWIKKREIFSKGHVQGQGQFSRSKTLNSNKKRTDGYFVIKLTTVIEINQRHLSARSFYGQGQLSRSKL